MIKKLFTSILLLGVALASWATITLTPSEEETILTVKAEQGDDVISYFQTINGTSPTWAGKVTKLVLSGAGFTNGDMSSDAFSTFITKCAGEGNTIYLDLSDCTGLVSKFISVVDTGDPYTDDYLDAFFTAEGSSTVINKIEASETKREVEIKYNDVETHKKKAQIYDKKANIVEKYFYNYGTEIEPEKVIKREDGTYYFVDEWGNEVEVEIVTYVSYENEDQQTVSFNSRDYNYNDKLAELIQVGDDYFYYWYTYETENGSVTKKDTKDLTKEGNDYYYYWYTYQDEKGDDKLAKDTKDLTLNPENGEYSYVYYSYTDMDDNVINTKDTQKLTLDDEGNYWYIFYSYSVNNEEKKQDNTKDLVLENGKYYYVYATEDGSIASFRFGNAKIKINGITFPDKDNDNFTFIPNELFQGATALKTAVFDTNIVAIGNHAFSKAGLTEVVLPSSITEIGGGAFEETSIQRIDLSGLSITKLRFSTFQDCKSLTVVDFPNSIKEIHKDAFQRSALKEVNLGECHQLRLLAYDSFDEITALKSVIVCSHEKVIKGGASGAFHLCTSIKTVEIIGCEGTDVTKCVCENRAFEWDITHNQTAALNAVETCARLIYPRNMALDMIVKSSSTPYTSTFDYFVGDYKAGVVIKQENLLAYYRQVPTDGYGSTKDENENPVVLDEPSYKGNGWLEFINVGEFVPIIPDKGQFLRTYSRTEGTGPVLLPIGDDAIHAFRVLDFNVKGYEEGDPGYVENENGEKIYTSGYLKLKELVVTIDGKKYSYVPENTGVVFYSTKMEEDAGLVLNPYTDATYEGYLQQEKYVEAQNYLDNLFVQYPNTGEQFDDSDVATTTSKVNMLVPSRGDEYHLSPTSPWEFTDNDNGGYYTNPRVYRNFSLKAADQTWRRCKVSYLRANRAFAQLPVGRFNNENENPGVNRFEAEDNGLNQLSSFNMIFEGEETTEIINVESKTNITQDDAWYTLQGVKVNYPTKGIYIHNNKKIVIK